MTEKVKVSKEVAEAIEKILDDANYPLFGIAELVAYHEKTTDLNEEQIEILRKYFDGDGYDDNPTVDDLIVALMGNYEIEQTPEEKWSEIYTEISQSLESEQNNTYEEGRLEGMIKTIEEMADDFNLKIKGVNA